MQFLQSTKIVSILFNSNANRIIQLGITFGKMLVMNSAHTLEIIQQTLEFFSSTLSPILSIRPFPIQIWCFLFYPKNAVGVKRSQQLHLALLYFSQSKFCPVHGSSVHCVIINTVVGGTIICAISDHHLLSNIFL